jgi:hypothetical protein
MALAGGLILALAVWSTGFLIGLIVGLRVRRELAYRAALPMCHREDDP